MNEMLEQKKQEFERKHSKRKLWLKAVSLLCAVTMLATTYALILPALTLEKTYCGKKEHTHSVGDGCYTESKTLTCAMDETGHTHDGSCYAEQSVLSCTLAETEGHTHTAACLGEAELACELEENEEHSHGAECYAASNTYVCGKEEAVGHSHSADCYTAQRDLICGKETAEGHIHGDGCYYKTLDLTCKKEEHTHSLACYSNPEADVETASVWERSFEDVELTGVWADDVLAIADTQLGYTESTKNYAVMEDGETKKGYTRFGAWYGDSYGDWCAMFVSFCLNYAKVDRDMMPFDSNCGIYIDKLTEKNLYHDSGYLPKPGDLIFFDWELRKNADHVGLVYEIIKDDHDAPSKIKTIEGNSNDRVQYREYEITDERILGYGKLPENPNPKEEIKPAQSEQAVLTAITENGVIITMEAPAESLPFPAEELTLEASVVEDEVAKALIESEAAEPEDENVRRESVLFNIRLMHGGEEVQPIGPVHVSFSGIDVPKDDAQVYHVDTEADKAEEVTSETKQDGTITAETDHFSIYGVTYTVDFKHGEYSFSLNGYKEAYLSEIFRALHIDREIAEIDKVEFSNPELLQIKPWTVDDCPDYMLRSIQPFDTQEALTISFDDGEMILINVTDPLVYADATNKVVVGGSTDNFMSAFPFMTTRINSKINTNPDIEFTTTNSAYYFDGTHVRFGGYIGSYTVIYPGGSYTMKFKNAASFSDGSTGHVIITYAPQYIANQVKGAVYWVELSENVRGGWACAHTSSASNLGGTRVYMNINVKIVKADGTSLPSGEKVIYGYYDLDGRSSLSGYLEEIVYYGGALSKAYMPSSNWLEVSEYIGDNTDTANGLWFRSARDDYNTYNSGFALLGDPNGVDFGWWGSEGAGTCIFGNTAAIEIRPQYKYFDTNKLSDWTVGDTVGTVAITDEATGENITWSDVTASSNTKYLTRYAGFGKNAPVSITAPAEGYYLSDFAVDDVSVLGNVVNNRYTVNNLQSDVKADVYYLPITGTVTIDKKDAKTGDLLTGAQFTLTGTSSVHGAVSLTATDNGDGTYTFTDVPYGGPYTVTETVAPVGYDTAPSQEISITTQGETVSLEFVDHKTVYDCELTVSKTVAGDPQGVNNTFRFDVTIVKEENGQIVERFVPADGSYKVLENGQEIAVSVTKSPEGKLTALLGHGQSLVISKIPSGFTAIATETEDSRYTTSCSAPDAQISADERTASYIMTGDHSIAFTNTRSTVDLTISKTVMGGGTDSFAFSARLEDENGAPVQLPSGTGYTVDSSAPYLVTFQMKGGESVTLKGVPVGTKATVTETKHDGYTVLIKDTTAGGTVLSTTDSAEITVTRDQAVEIQNNPGVALPHTGGVGTTLYTLGGIGLLLSALMFGFRLRRKRERRANG